MVVAQADMWDLDGNTASHLAGYKPIVESILDNTKAFGKPVLLFNGDSHTYLSDNPLANPSSDPFKDINAVYGISTAVPNLHRVVVHGKTLPLTWLRLTVDPTSDNGLAPEANASAFGPFSWQNIEVPS